MAAPATTTRSTPLGIMLKNGYSTKIAFALDTDISLWERAVTPPAFDGGDAIDTTTMFNSTWVTKFNNELVMVDEVNITVGYDPDAYDEVLAIINTNGSITCHFPDGSTLDFFGYLRRFEPQEMSRGTLPEASCVITPTNWDSANNVESGPVMTEVAGT